jgi:membrane protein DedA with SNARE-associated domain
MWHGDSLCLPGGRWRRHAGRDALAHPCRLDACPARTASCVLLAPRRGKIADPQETPAIEHFITQYGLIAVFAGVFLEGEAAAIAGGVMAHHDLLPLWQVAAAAFLGAFCWDLGVFVAARRWRGHPWLERQLARPIVARAMGGVHRNPRKLASLFRFVPGMRIVGPMVLAQSALPTGGFALHAGSSALVWALAYVIFGVAIGEFLAHVFDHLTRPEHLALVAVVGVVIVGGLTFRHLRRRRGP